jgi:hypothetical protein
VPTASVNLTSNLSQIFIPERAMLSNKVIVAGRFLGGLAVCFCASMMATPAHASAHLWNITEIYSNSSGSLQFIEMFTTFTGQSNFVTTRTIAVTNGVTTNTFTVPSTTLAGSTANRNLLFGTAGIQAAGGPAPDFIIPNNFLFTSGGTINFFGAGDGPYTPLPIDGTSSRVWGGNVNNAVNSPTNYSAQSGVVVVPEPTSIVLVSLALGSFYALKRRRDA